MILSAKESKKQSTANFIQLLCKEFATFKECGFKGSCIGYCGKLPQVLAEDLAHQGWCVTAHLRKDGTYKRITNVNFSRGPGHVTYVTENHNYPWGENCCESVTKFAHTIYITSPNFNCPQSDCLEECINQTIALGDFSFTLDSISSDQTKDLIEKGYQVTKIFADSAYYFIISWYYDSNGSYAEMTRNQLREFSHI